MTPEHGIFRSARNQTQRTVDAPGSEERGRGAGSIAVVQGANRLR